MLCGLTASTRTSLRRTTSTLDSKTATPVSACKSGRAAGSGSLAQIESAGATPARSIPLTSAVAILPAPMKPQPNSDFADLATLETSLMNLPRKRLRAIVLFLPDCNNSWVKPG